MACNTDEFSVEVYDSSTSELLSIIDQEISVSKDRLNSYEKKLGLLLRVLSKKPQSSAKSPLDDLKMMNKSKKGDGKDWLNYQSMMLYNGDPELGKAQIYFDSMAELRDKISTLENIAKALRGLVSSGLNGGTRCLAMFKDGIPIKFVLLNSREENVPKLTFQGRFISE